MDFPLNLAGRFLFVLEASAFCPRHLTPVPQMHSKHRKIFTQASKWGRAAHWSGPRNLQEIGMVHTASCKKCATGDSCSLKRRVDVDFPPSYIKKQLGSSTKHTDDCHPQKCTGLSPNTAQMKFLLWLYRLCLKPDFDFWVGTCTVSRLLEVTRSPHRVMCYPPRVNILQHVSNNIQGPKSKKYISSC